nr:MAG TPA: hypothetical protein [Caudoviricetes sp.]
MCCAHYERLDTRANVTMTQTIYIIIFILKSRLFIVHSNVF